MKTIFFALVFSAALPGCCQTIFIANSNPGAVGGTNVFTGNNAAYNAYLAAQNGDIIYIVPSPVMYFGFGLENKSVSLIGGGFNPEGGGPVSTLYSLVSLANNVRISGLVIVQSISINNSYSGVIFEKCRLHGFSASSGVSLGNIIVQNCIIGESLSGTPINLPSANSNFRISNNVIYGTSGPIFAGSGSLTIEHNLLINGGSNYPAFTSIADCVIRNNIFYGLVPTISTSYANNTQQNNLCTMTGSPTFPTANGNTSSGNIEGTDPMLTNFTMSSAFDLSSDLTLKAGSPAIGAGLDGVDIGVMGGLQPFDPSGSALPTVQSVVAPNTFPQGSNMNVRIRAKGN